MSTWERTDMNFIKRKNNKLKIGDRVQARPELVGWYVSHMNENWKVGGATEIKPDAYADVAGWLSAHLTEKMPVGKVVGYGSRAAGPINNGDPASKWVELDNESCVRIDFKLRYGKYSTYVHERDVKKVKK
jgi:hypothetical protein